MSSLGNLGECLIDSDAETIVRARRLRGKALILSVAAEAVMIGAMLVWPLVTPGVLPRRFVFTPAPPYDGGWAHVMNVPHGAEQPRSQSSAQHYTIIVQPPTIPPHVQDSAGADEPNVGTGLPAHGGEIPGAMGGDGSPIPGGSEDGRPTILPPPPPRPSAPVRKSASVMEAELIRRVQPAYPVVARVARISGTVELRAIIATDGSVKQLEILSGNMILAQAAVAAVREWRYRPTRLDGVDVEVETLITVNFVLDR
jgi:periplasmic protein TonB